MNQIQAMPTPVMWVETGPPGPVTVIGGEETGEIIGGEGGEVIGGEGGG
jgi:hypothetical protein